MLDKIKAFFEDHLAHDAGSGGGSRSAKGERAVQLASCALLLEMMRIDQESKLVEEQALRTAIQQTTQLDESAVDELIALAQAELDESVDYFQFTSLINEHFSPAQKLEVIEAMWLIAYSDHRSARCSTFSRATTWRPKRAPGPAPASRAEPTGRHRSQTQKKGPKPLFFQLPPNRPAVGSS